MLQWKKLRGHPELVPAAAAWFSDRWRVPLAAYQQSMQDCLACHGPVPQWYVGLDARGVIVAGAGVIDNDFHSRRDLWPNVCALFVQPEWRGQGVARQLLALIRKDMGQLGVPVLYLVTDHRGFYEKCGWHFVGAVGCDDGTQSRLYTAHCLLDPSGNLFV